MRAVLLTMLLIANPAVAKKPDVEALTAQAAQRPSEALLELDAALLEAKSRKDLAVLHALRAQALATAAGDPEFAAAHPDWVADATRSIATSQEQSTGGAHALQRDLAAARVVEVILASLEGDGQLSESSLAGLASLADHRAEPELYLVLGHARLRGNTADQAVLAVQAAIERVLSDPSAAHSAQVASSALDMVPSLWSQGAREQVVELFAAIEQVHDRLGAEGPQAQDLGRRLVWAQLVTTGMRPPAAVIAAATAYLAAQPQDVRVWTALGMYLHEADDLDGAETALRNGIILDPSQFEGHYALGTLYVARAARTSQSLLALPLDAPTERGDELQARIRADHTSAREVLEVAHRLSPDDLGTLSGLVQVCAALDDLEAYRSYQRKFDVRRSQ